MDYKTFLKDKTQLAGQYGFDPLYMPDQAFDFQKHLITWAVKKGRAALFADCGMGKTLMQLAWAENVCRKTGGKVLILTPLAVGHQTEHEAKKFGINAKRSGDGSLMADIVITNYERLHLFNTKYFVGVVCDESSILKNFDGKIKAAITEFMRTQKYRLLCTATAAPNDFIELGTSAEALGEIGFMDMLGRFFKKADATYCRKQETQAGTYYLKPHATKDFWRWVASWARAVRKPSDLGFSDRKFVLPELILKQHLVTATQKNPDFLFDMPAVGLAEQRAERSRTVADRCKQAADIANGTDQPVICWCHLNSESEALKKLIPGSVEVSGKDSDETKEQKFREFETGKARVIVTKPSIAGFGLNWQHCAIQTFFPSHSFEQYYQAVRRSWRFGQKQSVQVHIITTEGEQRVLNNLKRKAEAADKMFADIVQHMSNELQIENKEQYKTKTEIPEWL